MNMCIYAGVISEIPNVYERLKKEGIEFNVRMPQNVAHRAFYAVALLLRTSMFNHVKGALHRVGGLGKVPCYQVQNVGWLFVHSKRRRVCSSARSWCWFHVLLVCCPQTITAGKFKRTITPFKKTEQEDVDKAKEDIAQVRVVSRVEVCECAGTVEAAG